MNENQINYDSATSAFLPFAGLRIESISCERVQDWLDTIILRFENESLVIKAEPDYDSIHLSRLSNTEVDRVHPSLLPAPNVFSQYIGQNFAWGWIIVNQQNYFDGVVLSFNDIEPKILMNVMASELKVFEVSEVDCNGE